MCMYLCEFMNGLEDIILHDQRFSAAERND